MTAKPKPNDDHTHPLSLWVLCAFAGAFVAILMTWLVQGNDFLLYRVFAPKMEAARRETYEQSKAYNDGMAQELRAMQLDYVKGTPDQKRAIGSIVLHRVAGVDLAKMPADTRAFVSDMKREQGL